MIQNILKIFAIVIVAIVQVTFMPYLGIHGAWPNLILLLALIFVILDLDLEAWLVAGVGGLVLDFASPLFFGLNALLLAGAVLLMKTLLIKFLTSPNLVITGLLLMLSALFYDALLMLVARNFLWPLLGINGVVV